MTIRIEALDKAPERFNTENNVFLKHGFRTALAKEFRLKAINLGFDFEGQTRWLPAYQKNAEQLVIGAGFDKTGQVDQIAQALPVSINGYSLQIEALVKQLEQSPITQLELRTQHRLPFQKDRADKVELAIHLDIPCAERLKQFSRSTRRNLRLPFKHCFHFVIDNTEKSLNDFYQLYLLHIHELGSLPQSKRFFAELLAACQEDIVLFVGYIDTVPVIASFHLLSTHEMYGAWAGSHPDYKKYSVFISMLWQITEYCEATGRKTFNLGRTSLNSNVYHFKKRLTNQERKIYHYTLDTQRHPTARPTFYNAASWLIRRTSPCVMKALSRTFIHRFY